MARPKKYIIHLSTDEKVKLKSLIKKKSTSKNILRRCQILLELDENNPTHLTHKQIAKTYGVCQATVTNIVADYANHGMEKAITYQRNPNSNAKRKIDGRTEAKLIKIACGPAPTGHSRWTLRLLTNQINLELDTPIGKDSIREALKKTNFDLI